MNKIDKAAVHTALIDELIRENGTWTLQNSDSEIVASFNTEAEVDAYYNEMINKYPFLNCEFCVCFTGNELYERLKDLKSFVYMMDSSITLSLEEFKKLQYALTCATKDTTIEIRGAEVLGIGRNTFAKINGIEHDITDYGNW